MERRKLFRHELVPAGTRFRLSVEADRIRPQELKALLGLLTRWNGGEGASIGKGKSKDQGRVRWEVEDVLVLTCERLFDTTGQRSALWFSEAVSEAPGSPHPQFFNAVDRFTGGVAKEKLYNVNAVLCDELRFTVTFDPETPNLAGDGDWWKGLLLLVLRDSMEGDLAIGWGKARGYGAFCLKVTNESGADLDSWAACLRELRCRWRPDRWIEALQDKVAQTLSDCRKSGLERAAQ